MLFSKLTFVSSLAAFAAAQDTTDINFDKVPAECTDVCTQVAAIVNGCNNDSNNNVAARFQCMCTANSANNLIPNCQSCITKYGNNNDNTNVATLLKACNFNAAATSTGVVGGVGVTAAQTTTSVDTVTSIVSRTSVAIIITSTGSAGRSMSMSGSGTASRPTNAAPAKTAGVAMGAGALAFAMGML